MAKDENYCEHCDDYVSHTTDQHEFDLPADYEERMNRMAMQAAGPNPHSKDGPAMPHWTSTFNPSPYEPGYVHPIHSSRRYQ